MNFLKFSFLIIFISLIAGLTPTLVKFLMSNSPTSRTAIFTPRVKADSVSRSNQSIRILIAENAKIPVYIADDDTERAKGLSGLASIPRDYGMLFIFNRADYHGIWMKDMFFPIDIIWIGENNIIVHIEKNILPDTYPRIFTSPIKALFVLELSAGMTDFYNLKIGEKIISV